MSGPPRATAGRPRSGARLRRARALLWLAGYRDGRRAASGCFSYGAAARGSAWCWRERAGEGAANLRVDGERVDALEDPDFAGGGLDDGPVAVPLHVDPGGDQGHAPDLECGIRRGGHGVCGSERLAEGALDVFEGYLASHFDG